MDNLKGWQQAIRTCFGPTCTEPNRAACPRRCMTFCNKAEEERLTEDQVNDLVNHAFDTHEKLWYEDEAVSEAMADACRLTEYDVPNGEVAAAYAAWLLGDGDAYP